jgi:tRNA(Ile)-lysidine synthase TilS/MesJ
MKRGVLYSCCRAKGFNKLVLGQHLDDMAESFFMSAFRNGQVCPIIARHQAIAAHKSRKL